MKIFFVYFYDNLNQLISSHNLGVDLKNFLGKGLQEKINKKRKKEGRAEQGGERNKKEEGRHLPLITRVLAVQFSPKRS